MFGIELNLAAIGALVSQSLSAGIAIIAGSTFLYVLSRNIRNQVTWAYSALLLFVTVTYIGDLGVSYSDELSDAAAWLRFQWAGIAFVPAAYVHLSHALLELTGSPSRGRRRTAAAALYLSALVFFLLGVTGDALVSGVVADPAPHLGAGPIFWLFGLYFAGAVLTSMLFIIRARQRSITRAMRRRMTLLLVPYAAPALAVFPFLVVASPSVLSQPYVFSTVLVIVDTALAVMLVAMAYPLIFFISLLPDRLVKAQMLQFLLRGPLVAIAALAVIIWVPRAGNVLGLPGDELMPFLAVGVILLLQWSVTLLRPPLERFLIYTGDQAEIRRIQELERRLLTGTDFNQLLESILAALCDYLRVSSAFVASLGEAGPRLERAIGLRDELSEQIIQSPELAAVTQPASDGGGQPVLVPERDLFLWNGFWLVPLRATDHSPDNGPSLVGVLGVAANQEATLDADEETVMQTLAGRVAEVLEDRRLQSEVFAALEGLLPEMEAIQRLRGEARYGGVEAITRPTDELLRDPDFSQFVKDALSHYWGGPKLSGNRLMDLSIVRQALANNEGNPQRALREVLLQAIERLKPSGQRSLTTAEWILYNILEMRFIEGRKVRDVAIRLAMSESDLYRKQRVAIEAVAVTIASMERSSEATGAPSQEPRPLDEANQADGIRGFRATRQH